MEITRSLVPQMFAPWPLSDINFAISPAFRPLHSEPLPFFLNLDLLAVQVPKHLVKLFHSLR